MAKKPAPKKKTAPKKAKSKSHATKPIGADPRWEAANDLLSLTVAYIMLSEGYHFQYVSEFTGVKPEWFDNMPLDEDGYGSSFVEDENG